MESSWQGSPPPVASMVRSIPASSSRARRSLRRKVASPTEANISTIRWWKRVSTKVSVSMKS